MGIALDQTTTQPITHVSSATSLVATFVNQPAADSTVIVFVWSKSTGSPLTVTDNGSPGNTYAVDIVGTAGSNSAHIARADNIALPSSGNLAVTASFPGPGTIELGAASFIG